MTARTLTTFSKAKAAAKIRVGIERLQRAVPDEDSPDCPICDGSGVSLGTSVIADDPVGSIPRRSPP